MGFPDTIYQPRLQNTAEAIPRDAGYAPASCSALTARLGSAPCDAETSHLATIHGLEELNWLPALAIGAAGSYVTESITLWCDASTTVCHPS